MKTTSGIFRTRESVTHAVRKLAEHGVPADEIAVRITDDEGNPKRRVVVGDEAGTLRGAIIGGICGAIFGVAIVAVVLSGVLGPTPTQSLGISTLAGALRVILVLAAAGVPLGAIIGLGYWDGRAKITPTEVRAGSVVVAVESDDLADTAREVLTESGAVEVEVSDDRRQVPP